MKTSNQTVLITGGGSGIGLEMAKLFNDIDSKVLIIGRNGNKLEEAAKDLKNVSTFAADITEPEDVEKLVERIKENYSDLSLLINNAATADLYDISSDEEVFEKTEAEILTNYLSVVRLNQKLLPLLKNQNEAAIVNVTSVVAFIPSIALSGYSHSKAALHSYSKALRLQLEENTNVKVFELMPPLVKTEFSKAIGGLENGMEPEDVAKALIEGLENDVYEIHVAGTQNLYDLYLSNPEQALRVLNNQ